MARSVPRCPLAQAVVQGARPGRPALHEQRVLRAARVHRGARAQGGGGGLGRAQQGAARAPGLGCGLDWGYQGSPAAADAVPLCLPLRLVPLQGRVDDFKQQYVEQAWGPLLALLRADARQAVPAGLAGDKAARQAVKDRWTAVNRALADAQAQQVGRRVGGGRLSGLRRAGPVPHRPAALPSFLPCLRAGVGRAQQPAALCAAGRAGGAGAAAVRGLCRQVPPGALLEWVVARCAWSWSG